MFEALTKGFRNARKRLQGIDELTEENLAPALREVKLSLLEADVELGVTKRFLQRVKERALGTEYRRTLEAKGRTLRITPLEQFVRICQDELERMMALDGPRIVFAKKPKPTGIMIVGLQGSGKTTSAAKLALHLEKEHRKKVLLVAADTQRPGAVEQLQVLGERIDVPVFTVPGASPIEICERAVKHARHIKRDTIVFDTAGRLAIDEPLMRELEEIKRRTRPNNVFLVVDAMIGQDAVKTARAFHERLGLTGVVLTKLDGDARGGAALSIKEVTGTTVKFVGMGEALDRLEEFRPEGMASRILGMGDVVGLMKDFEEVVDAEKAERDAKRMLRGQFTFDDFLEQIEAISQMGPLQDIFEKLPFFADAVPEGFQVDERELVKTKAIISSMTRQERRDPELLPKQPTRIRRVARGSGRTEQEVVDLLQRFLFMRKLMGDIGQQAGLLSRIPGMKQLAHMRQLRQAIQTTGMEDNPLMANLATELLEAAVAGDGPPPGMGTGPGGPSARRRLDKAAIKHKRKLERKARKKARRRRK